MPELPEVETVRRGLEPVMTGARFIKVEQRRADLRFPLPPRFSQRLVGRDIVGLGRRAKYLLIDLDDGSVLIIHLGMSGRLTVVAPGDVRGRLGAFHHAAGEADKHDHIEFYLSNGYRVIYNDARRFGSMDLVRRFELEKHPLFTRLGIEPTGNALSGDALAKLFAARRTPLKAALLDQSLVAGLGNIYVCEALHRARISPKRAAGTLPGKAGKASPAVERLAESIRLVIAEAIEAGGSSLRDFQHTDGTLGYFQHRFRVYDREGEPCPTRRCPGTISRFVQGGRSTFWCPNCQK